MDIQDEILLERVRTEHEMLVESNRGMLVFSQMILRGTFILNGAAAVAVLASKDPSLYLALLGFGWGALASAWATGVVYLVQGMVTAAWHRSLVQNPLEPNKLSPYAARAVKYGNSCERWENWFRLFAMVLVGASLGCFAFGLGSASGIF